MEVAFSQCCLYAGSKIHLAGTTDKLLLISHCEPNFRAGEGFDRLMPVGRGTVAVVCVSSAWGMSFVAA
jgi:hypothetical protein